jgi:hypothetical protein
MAADAPEWPPPAPQAASREREEQTWRSFMQILITMIVGLAVFISLAYLIVRPKKS